MAIYRTIPKCIFCGAEIARAKYLDQTNLCSSIKVIGDTFQGWEFLPHDCKERQEFEKEMKKVSPTNDTKQP